MSLARTLGTIYDVAVAPDRWPALLNRPARDFDRHFGSMNIGSANCAECRYGRFYVRDTRAGSADRAAARSPGKGGTLRLSRPSGKPPLALVVIPIRYTNDSFFFADQPASILRASDPADRETIDPAVLTELFGLARAEAGAGQRLAGGSGASVIAASSGCSIHTLRNLLARIMAKTETSRQSELVGL